MAGCLLSWGAAESPGLVSPKASSLGAVTCHSFGWQGRPATGAGSLQALWAAVCFPGLLGGSPGWLPLSGLLGLSSVLTSTAFFLPGILHRLGLVVPSRLLSSPAASPLPSCPGRPG